MKKCGYCGAQSAGNSEICPGCGSFFSDPSHDVSLTKKGGVGPVFECVCYLLAVPVAYLFSIFVFFISGSIINNMFINSLFTGFFGVFLGACLFPRSNLKFRNRVFGSALLLIIGLVFEVNFFLKFIPPAPPSHIPFSILDMIATAIGGLAAGGLHHKLRPREDTNSTPIQPVASSAER